MADCHDLFQDLGHSLEENDDTQRGAGVVGWFAWYIQDYPVGVFERGGVVAEGDQRGQVGEEYIRVVAVYRLPYRTRYFVGAGGRGGGGLRHC